jgi:hypothetical protein
LTTPILASEAPFAYLIVPLGLAEIDVPFVDQPEAKRRPPNCPRRVGPLRAAGCDLRAKVEWAEEIIVESSTAELIIAV